MRGFHLRRESVGVAKYVDMPHSLVVPVQEKDHVDTGSCHEPQEHNIMESQQKYVFGRICFRTFRRTLSIVPHLGRIVVVLKALNIYRNKGIDQQVGDPTQKAEETGVLPSKVFQPHPATSFGTDGDCLKIAQEASGTERKSPGHSMDIKS